MGKMWRWIQNTTIACSLMKGVPHDRAYFVTDGIHRVGLGKTRMINGEQVHFLSGECSSSPRAPHGGTISDPFNRRSILLGVATTDDHLAHGPIVLFRNISMLSFSSSRVLISILSSNAFIDNDHCSTTTTTTTTITTVLLVFFLLRSSQEDKIYKLNRTLCCVV